MALPNDPRAKLQALLAAKKAAAAAAAAEEIKPEDKTDDKLHTGSNSAVPDATNSYDTAVCNKDIEANNDSVDNSSSIVSANTDSSDSSNKSVDFITPDTDHAEADALRMQMAELEDALDNELPEFRTILRDIHRKLVKDPDCVTAFTDEGIGKLVEGLIKHANAEIVAPAKIKAAKKLAKNVQISADDL